MQFNDPLLMPLTGETPQQRLDKSISLLNTPGQQYVEKRGITIDIAHSAGVRFDPDWNGRAAVLFPMMDNNGNLCSLHGRYLEQAGDQNKMFTIGAGGGMVILGNALHSDPIIIVEGLFDALSLLVCGFSALATVGRRAPWLPNVCNGKKVFLAFDATRSGEADTAYYKDYLKDSFTKRMLPPYNKKDWNSALTKKGAVLVEDWISRNIRLA